jgi:hypothetical protein
MEILFRGSDKELNEWAKFLAQPASQRTAGSPPAWPHISASAVECFSDTYAGWYTPYAVTLKPRTPLDTLAKNIARDILKKGARSFVNGYIRYSFNVSAEDRASLGIFDTKPSLGRFRSRKPARKAARPRTYGLYGIF